MKMHCFIQCDLFYQLSLSHLEQVYQIRAMKSIWKRFQYYGIGLGIGLLMTFIFFQNRGCSWLPENRVKNAILENVIVLKKSDIAAIEAQGYTVDNFIQLLNNGDVKFGLSKRDGEPKYYFLQSKTKEGKEIKAQFELRKDGFVSLCTPLNDNTVITSDLLQGEAHIVHLPLDTALVAFDERAKCQARQMAISEKDVLAALESGGRVDYDYSDFDEVNKPAYQLIFSMNNRSYSAKAVWYKTKIYIHYFNHVDAPKCD